MHFDTTWCTYPKVVIREECLLCSCCCIDLFCISQEQLSTKRMYEEEEEEREREGGGQRSLDMEIQIKRWH